MSMPMLMPMFSLSLSLSVDEMSVDEVSVDDAYVDNSELDPFLLSTLISPIMSEFEL
jgi:hypothetical protein